MKTEKAKIFTGVSDNFALLEKEVNKWLAAKPGIEIVDRKMGVAAGTNILDAEFVNCTIVIFYRE